MTASSVTHRPAISNVLIKASANIVFRTRLLNNPDEALNGMNLPPEDVAILADIQAPTLQEYACQLKTRLIASPA